MKAFPNPVNRAPRETRFHLWNSVRYYAVGLWNYVDEDHCFLLAAGIAFNVLYCLLPLSLVLFYFLTTALSSEKAISIVLRYISESFPLPVYEEELKSWVARKMTGLGGEGTVAGIVGGVSLFWLASILFSTLRTSLNAIFNMTPKSNAIYQKLLDFVLMVVVMFLLMASTFLDPVVTVLQRLGSTFLPEWLVSLLNTAVPYLLSLGTSILLYILLFRMLPHQRLSRKVVFVSATTTVILTELMRWLFSYYMGHLSSVGALYGTYAFLVGTSLWVYYASLVFLIGAEVGWLYKERHEVIADPVVLPAVAAFTKDPGEFAIEPGAIQEYEKVKHNPTRPAGELKPPPEPLP